METSHTGAVFPGVNHTIAWDTRGLATGRMQDTVTHALASAGGDTTLTFISWWVQRVTGLPAGTYEGTITGTS